MNDKEEAPTTSSSRGFRAGQLSRLLEGQLPLLSTTLQQATSMSGQENTVASGEKTSVANLKGAVEQEGDDYPDLDILREDPRGERSSDSGQNTEKSFFDPPASDVPPQPPSGEPNPVVLLYHTHNAENYGADGGSSRLDGRNAGVFMVGKRLGTRLQEKQKLTVVHSDAIHDYPSYDLAYVQSRKTLLALLQRYPNPLAIIDLHRDAVPLRETVTVGGRKAARILIVVGTDARAAHPRWKDNLRFAEAVAAKLDEKAPGLCKGVITKAGRYHQQLHPRALLVEIGGDRNSVAEAQAAAEIFADALAKVIQEKGLLHNAKRGG
ncbi:stage II sporulation protein P [Heliomicrobium modesticaldum]|nr:stage II sporulation protein P [Heliomicrobium modesticaldum]